MSEPTEFLRALTRVLWRELLLARRIRIIAEWDQQPGLVNISITDPAGVELVSHTVIASDDAELYTDTWPEIEYQPADPSIDWLMYQVDGWLTAEDEILLDSGGGFPGMADDIDWDDLDDAEALEVAHAAVTRLEHAIRDQDVAVLRAWTTALPWNGGFYSQATVRPWSDDMTWEALSGAEKSQIRDLLQSHIDRDQDSGCDALLLLTDIADQHR